ncbi:MAG: hypothetical protein NUV63_12775 [Gallionella sp.]|nr:hypothetical protein [Gallionella sp.]
MKLVPINYFIDHHGGSRPVSGLAIETNLPVRMCLRREWSSWRCDHYDTGYGMNYMGAVDSELSAEEAAKKYIDYLRKNINSGQYARALAAAGIKP